MARYNPYYNTTGKRSLGRKGPASQALQPPRAKRTNIGGAGVGEGPTAGISRAVGGTSTPFTGAVGGSQPFGRPRFTTGIKPLRLK